MLRVKTRIRSVFVSFSSEEYILHLYNSRQITALMIENTFTSAPDVLKKLPGIIGHLTFLVTQKWYSAQKVSHMPTTLPILMLSGTHDTVIPSSHMEKLWEVASTRNPPAKLRSGTAPEYIPPQNDMFRHFPYGQHSEFYLSPSLYIFFNQSDSQIQPSINLGIGRQFFDFWLRFSIPLRQLLSDVISVHFRSFFFCYSDAGKLQIPTSTTSECDFTNLDIYT